MTKGSERNYILKIMEDMTKKSLFVNQVLDDYFFVYDFDKQQRSFISKVVYGSIENQSYIDYCINQVSKIKVNKMKPVIRYIMRMTAYQLLFMDKVPSHGAINEAVKLTKMRKLHKLSGFVNGVLRSLDRDKESIIKSMDQLKLQERLSVKYSISSPIVGYLLKQYSEDELIVFLQESLKTKPTCIRVQEKDLHIIEKMKKSAKVELGHVLSNSFYVSEYNVIAELPGFDEGEFLVQDESSSLVGLIANPKSEDKIIDTCAAPGGKTTHVAQLLQGSGLVTSCDVSEYKLEKIAQNIDRLNLSNVTTGQYDATKLEENFIDAYDIVIADVPCSGLGILRNKPDIKLNMDIDKIKSLIPLQKEILNNVCKYVKPYGTLLYSTCTINQRENIDQVNQFLEEHSNFELVPLDEELQNINGISDSDKLSPFIKDGCLQLMTSQELTDGFFIAKLKRIQ